MFSVSCIRPQTPHVCIPCIIYSKTLFYPQINPSRLPHGTQVCYFYMGQSRIYTIPYPHLAHYTAITLPKGTLWGHGALTLWYHHINTYRLCHNGNVVWLCLTHTCPCMSTLKYNVMVPHISPSWLHHGTQVSYFDMAHSLICTMPYTHLATYMAITLTKGTLWCPQS